MKKLLFSLTKKDFIIDYFTVGGHGGSGKDTSNSGVRITHKASGASSDCTLHRSAQHNREEAFKKLVNTPIFRRWHREVCLELMYGKTIEERVKEAMKPENIKVEYYGQT